MPNRLAHETSPYLRQHANNPVDWYPWSEEALSKAKAENKPIVLSVGYSACHWCHVMEHESFENDAIAALMNENFVSIKVDREERPDLDHIYQNVSQLMTRSGGWPLTVFLTPDLKPFFGGTYFPPDDRYGRPGFSRVLSALAQAYKEDPASISENARRLTEAIQKIETTHVEGHKRPDAESLRKVVDSFVSTVDWQHGGFGGAPKFPQTMNLSMLWRYGVAHGFGMAQEASVLALTKMAQGGIYDQLGGGFHRYSVDERWAVPHFEKMLYDNALLLKLYSEALLTSAPEAMSADTTALFTRIVSETTSYVLREMKAPEGAFYAAQDADSEGEEGKFFVWDQQTVRDALTVDEANAFISHYGVSELGNFEHTGQTVLFIDMAVAEVAKKLGRDAADVERLLSSGRKKLFELREKRIKPARDEKIIASWNGLMISGLCWASRALRETGHGEIAEQALENAQIAFEFVQTHLNQGDNRLFSVFKDGKARFNAYLDDYAFMTMAALDLARVVDDQSEVQSLIAQARLWTDVVCTHFVDDARGGFYFTSKDHEALIQRPKTLYDQAIPSGNAVIIECLTALAEITGDASYERNADEHLYKLYPTLEQSPFGMGELACAAMMQVMGVVVVSGERSEAVCFHPHVFQKPIASGAEAHEILVCHRKTCSLPLVDVKAARKLVVEKTVS